MPNYEYYQRKPLTTLTSLSIAIQFSFFSRGQHKNVTNIGRLVALVAHMRLRANTCAAQAYSNIIPGKLGNFIILHANLWDTGGPQSLILHLFIHFLKLDFEDISAHKNLDNTVCKEE